MKNILITGANSYVGRHVEEWLTRAPNLYSVETLDLSNPTWREFDFSKYNVVFHVAGIAHVSAKKSMEHLYFSVNRDLTIETAVKAKESGVSHFIFMSSMIVYNSSETRITQETVPNPDNFYGKSKLEAEVGLQKLEDNGFRLTIIRAPMIYGYQSKGNFPKLIHFTRKAFLFPKYPNRRSMLYIDNLSNTIQHVIDQQIFGILFPQNRELVCTYDLINHLALLQNRRIFFTTVLNPFIRLLVNRISIVNKMFSDSYYEDQMSLLTHDFCCVDMMSSLKFIVERTFPNE